MSAAQYELWRREDRTDGNDKGAYRWMIWLVGPGEDASYAEWFDTEEEARAAFNARRAVFGGTTQP